MTLTTLEIAEEIATAAIDAHQRCDYYAHAKEKPAQAVLRTLRENHVWLHRTVQDAEGVIDGEAPTEVLPEVET